MSANPRIYVSLERPGGQLVVNGDLGLLAALLTALRPQASGREEQSKGTEETEEPTQGVQQ